MPFVSGTQIREFSGHEESSQHRERLKDYAYYRGGVLVQREAELGESIWRRPSFPGPGDLKCRPCDDELSSVSTRSTDGRHSPIPSASALDSFLQENSELYYHLKGDSVFCLVCKKSGKQPAHRVTWSADPRTEMDVLLEHNASSEHLAKVLEYRDGLRSKHEAWWRSFVADRRAKLEEKGSY